LILRPVRKFFSAATSKIKNASASKRQRRYDDPNDANYDPDLSELAAESSATGSDESMEGAHGSDDVEVIDVQSMNLPGRRWTAESYANARSVNRLHQDRDTNVLFFQTQAQQDVFFGHMLKKTVFSH